MWGGNNPVIFSESLNPFPRETLGSSLAGGSHTVSGLFAAPTSEFLVVLPHQIPPMAHTAGKRHMLCRAFKTCITSCLWRQTQCWCLAIGRRKSGQETVSLGSPAGSSSLRHWRLCVCPGVESEVSGLSVSS